MTTNKPGSVNQRPIFGCTSCFEDCSWPAEDLRVYDGECWCDLCWDERKWDFEDQPYWGELPHFVPPYEAEAEALKAENDRLRKDTARLDWLADPNNTIGNVQLPADIVEQHLDSLREAIDAAMTTHEAWS